MQKEEVKARIDARLKEAKSKAEADKKTLFYLFATRIGGGGVLAVFCMMS